MSVFYICPKKEEIMGIPQNCKTLSFFLLCFLYFARKPHLFIAEEKDIFDLVTADLCARLGLGVGLGVGSNARQPASQSFVYLNKNVRNNIKQQRKLTANS